MDLVPWKSFRREVSPFREMERLHGQMDQLFRKLMGESGFGMELTEEGWGPSVNISENKDNIIVKAELPGMETKDVNVSLSGDLLTIKGEKKQEEEEEKENFYCKERYHGSFQRSFRIPSTIKADQIAAKFDKGVLKITLPKAEEAKKKEIEVKVE
jgi:HSP20 family protein